MAGEDQERFEDYLELERYIEDLQAGRVAHPPTNLTPERARIYRMAALFRSASPGAADPSPDFAEALHTRLLAMDTEAVSEGLPQAQPELVQREQPHVEQQNKQEPPIPLQERQQRPAAKKTRSVPRRSLLTGGAVAAATLLAGTGIGAAIEHAEGNNSAATTHPSPYGNTPIVPDSIPTMLQHVTTMDKLGNGAVRFTAGAVVGYVIRNNGDPEWESEEEVIAFSAACTHMGCIVQWQDSDRRFHCPCHGGMFTEDGSPVSVGRTIYLYALPRLQTMVQKGNIYVVVPDVKASTEKKPDRTAL